tara:strand:+ start:4499 stop:4699 length:201 start_codon:yes stop_codon:yes gene_type:complete
MTRTGGLQNDTKRVKQQLPDAKKHQLVSFLKSGVRLIGYAFIPFDSFIAMGILLISEVIGIIEELV